MIFDLTDITESRKRLNVESIYGAHANPFNESNPVSILQLLLVILAFLSGFVALSHELLWTRRLIDLLGATEAVAGRVLGLFFLGLSIGGWLAARYSHRKQNSSVRLSIAEFSIAVLSLPIIFLPDWADGLVAALGTDGIISWQGHLFKSILVAGVVIPPSIMMGMTMPLFIRAMTELGGSIDRGGIWVYTFNMLGGVVGLGITSTFLLGYAGVRGAMICTAAGNLIIAVVALGPWLRRRRQIPHQEAATIGLPNDDSAFPSDAADLRQSGARRLFVLAFFSGVIVLSVEVLVLRLLALVAPSSIQTTSALLANVILFLALGAAAVMLLNRLGISKQIQLITGLAGGAVACVLCPLILYEVTDELVSIRYLAASKGETIGSIGSYWWWLCWIVAVSSGATMFFGGLVFPSILSIFAEKDPEGGAVGLLLATNGVGGLVGTELSNQLMIFQIGIYRGVIILAAAAALVSIIHCICENRKRTAIGIVFVTLLVGLLAIEPYDNLRYLSPRAEKSFKIEGTFFGEEGVLLLVQDETGARSLLMNNQYILGSSGVSAEAAERRQLLLPWTLYPESKTACCLGFATGISASGLEGLESPPSIDSIELSEKVAEIAKEFFNQQNGSYFQRSTNRLLLEDARTFIACADRKYDLIVADLFRPHGSGESRLFSIEHFRNVKRALRLQGLFCQWLPAHQLNKAQFETIAKTFLQVFPNTLVVTGGVSSGTPTIGLCAWQNDKHWNTKDLVEKIQKIRGQHERIRDVLALNPQLFIVGTLRPNSVASASTNTLDNALLEIDAGKFWITKDLRPQRTADNLVNGFLSGNNWPKFMNWLYKNSAPVLDIRHRAQYMEQIK